MAGAEVKRAIAKTQVLARISGVMLYLSPQPRHLGPGCGIERLAACVAQEDSQEQCAEDGEAEQNCKYVESHCVFLSCLILAGLRVAAV